MLHLILYSTSACHLCEEAEAMLLTLLNDSSRKQQRFSVEKVDIADNDDLLERYGIRIPVLECSNSGSELGWPFDREQLLCWLKALSVP